MDNSQLRDVSKAILFPTTEAEIAKQYSQQGAHVVSHYRRYWNETSRGFYQPIHLLARLENEQVQQPTLLSWGVRAALDENDVKAQNASIPVHLLSNLENYDLQSFPSKRRRQLRQCAKMVKMVEVTAPSFLQEQGDEVVLSALERTKFQDIPSRGNTRTNVMNFTNTAIS